MKIVGMIAVLAFAVVLAYIIGERLTTDAMAVVVGVAAGVCSSVPTSLVLVALLRRSDRMGYRSEQPAPPPAPAQLPPNVLVIDPMQMMRQYQDQLPLPPRGARPPDGGAHRLRVIGGDED